MTMLGPDFALAFLAPSISALKALEGTLLLKVSSSCHREMCVSSCRLQWTDKGRSLIVMKQSKTICLCCAESERLFMEACERMQAIGGQLVQISFEPFAETARLLYTSAFMAERYAGIRTFLEGKVGGLFPFHTISDPGYLWPYKSEVWTPEY